MYCLDRIKSYEVYSLSLSLSLPPHTLTLSSPIQRGVWNVPFVSVAMLISGKLLTQLKDDLPSYEGEAFDPDMTFAAWMRERVIGSLC